MEIHVVANDDLHRSKEKHIRRYILYNYTKGLATGFCKLAKKCSV
jgi:hypothetical protein